MKQSLLLLPTKKGFDAWHKKLEEHLSEEELKKLDEYGFKSDIEDFLGKMRDDAKKQTALILEMILAKYQQV